MPRSTSAANLVEGRIVVHPRGFGFLEIEGQPSAFLSPPDLEPFFAGDRVRAEVEEASPGRTTATKLALIARDRSEVFGSVVARGGREALRVDRTIGNSDWPLVSGSGTFGEGTVLVAAIEGAALRPLRVVDPVDASLERVVVRHGLREAFGAEVEAELRALRSGDGEIRLSARDLQGRRDLRDVPTVTIDAPVSRDLDDALAVLPATPDGALRLLVSIADVDALVAEGSALDREARRRGTSVYLAGRVLPMLPRPLSEDALSLLPGVERPALTVELRIDPEGIVTAVDLQPSVIRSTARLSYEDVAAFLDQGDEQAIPEAVRSTLRWLRTAAARIASTRAARGGISLVREEAHVTLDAITREPTTIGVRASTSAHVLVERLMVAANEAVAGWLVDRGLPGVFRVHDPPGAAEVCALAAWARKFGFEPGFGPVASPRTIAAFEAQFRGTTVAPALQTVLGRALGRARYTVHPGIHFALGAPRYLHFTSPIRRYADLAVHRIVKGFLAGARDRVAGEGALEELARGLDQAARIADRAENERLWMLAARHFSGRIGEVFDGNVVAVQPFGLVVQLSGMAISGTVAADALPNGPFRLDPIEQVLVSTSGGGCWSIGDRIEVEVAGANEDLGRIELVPRR
jgi:ribonuclease R